MVYDEVYQKRVMEVVQTTATSEDNFFFGQRASPVEGRQEARAGDMGLLEDGAALPRQVGKLDQGWSKKTCVPDVRARR